MQDFFLYFFGVGSTPEFALFTPAHLIPIALLLVAAVLLALTAAVCVGAADRRLAAAASKLDALSPLKVLGRGYALAQGRDGAVLKSAREVQVGDRITGINGKSVSSAEQVRDALSRTDGEAEISLIRNGQSKKIYVLPEGHYVVNKSMLENSDKHVFLCGSNKIGKKSKRVQCTLKDIDYFICDETPGIELVKKFNNTEFIKIGAENESNS